MPILPAPIVQRTREGYGDRTGRPELFAGLLLRLARATHRQRRHEIGELRRSPLARFIAARDSAGS